MTYLANKSILIVEDEPFIALDIAGALEDAGGQPVGPAATVADALALIAETPPDGAILDVNLIDGDVGPVIEALHGRAALLVQTAVGLPADVASKFPDVPVCRKPVETDELTRLLGLLLRARAIGGSGGAGD